VFGIIAILMIELHGEKLIDDNDLDLQVRVAAET
jgi:hypothetical protein